MQTQVYCGRPTFKISLNNHYQRLLCVTVWSHGLHPFYVTWRHVQPTGLLRKSVSSGLTYCWIILFMEPNKIQNPLKSTARAVRVLLMGMLSEWLFHVFSAQLRGASGPFFTVHCRGISFTTMCDGKGTGHVVPLRHWKNYFSYCLYQ